VPVAEVVPPRQPASPQSMSRRLATEKLETRSMVPAKRTNSPTVAAKMPAVRGRASVKDCGKNVPPSPQPGSRSCGTPNMARSRHADVGRAVPKGIASLGKLSATSSCDSNQCLIEVTNSEAMRVVRAAAESAGAVGGPDEVDLRVALADCRRQLDQWQRSTEETRRQLAQSEQAFGACQMLVQRVERIFDEKSDRRNSREDLLPHSEPAEMEEFDVPEMTSGKEHRYPEALVVHVGSAGASVATSAPENTTADMADDSFPSFDDDNSPLGRSGTEGSSSLAALLQQQLQQRVSFEGESGLFIDWGTCSR